MWQVEDLLRAYELSTSKVREALVAPYNLPEEGAAELLAWYENLMEMMRIEGVKGTGHLQINKNKEYYHDDIQKHLSRHCCKHMPYSLRITESDV